MKRILLLLLLASSTHVSLSQNISELRSHWARSWSKLKIPNLQLDYRAFVNAQCSINNLDEQTAFFELLSNQIAQVETENLEGTDRFDYQLIHYEVQLNQERLTLIQNTDGAFKGGGIYDEPNGKQWYAYLIRHWTSTMILPEEVSAYGWQEVKRIQNAIRQLKSRYNVDRSFTREPSEVESAFKNYEAFLEKSVWQVIPKWSTPSLKIQQGTNPNLSQVPGYYGGDALSYNLFDDPFDLSQIGWLYLHEGVPGHHFQLNSENRADIPEYRSSMSYSGFREGWAAYVEELAHEQGWYMGPEQRLSQMEWDLIRSIRLVIDVGLNHEGWSDEKAMNVWQSEISGMDHIGIREIARMRRWPAQVLTYKIGAKIIMESREDVLGTDRSKLALKAFHSRILSEGSIPTLLIPLLFKTP